jgi:hypothetical protein
VQCHDSDRLRREKREVDQLEGSNRQARDGVGKVRNGGVDVDAGARYRGDVRGEIYMRFKLRRAMEQLEGSESSWAFEVNES